MTSDFIGQRIRVIDSHTGGEPTRVVVEGGPNLGGGTMLDRRTIFRERFDEFRSAIVGEPRGSEVLVGALLCDAIDPSCAAGVIFFNNIGTIGMCGHGTIGVGVTLAHLGRIGPGRHRLETPVGIVAIEYDGGNVVAVENVPSYRIAAGVTIDVEGFGPLSGDVAWGGNWFFLTSEHGQDLNLVNIPRLTDFTWRIRRALERQGISAPDAGGPGGEKIDHIELFGPPSSSAADGKNFVLCPGGAYDRSPCGTGTSAKLACLVADGKLRKGQIWRQESITGSIFEGTARIVGERIIPTIRGSAFITAEATLLFAPDDPLRMGIRP
jgi:4-hydroxyproline epimerase